MLDPASEAPDDPEFPSGEWVGFYADHGARHRQDLHLTFAGGRVSGIGADAIGDFVIRGRYDAESKEVTWTKTYPGSHSVFYRGFREIRGIWGTWEIPPVATGGFQIWPRAEGEAEGTRAGAEKETPVEAGAPTPVGA